MKDQRIVIRDGLVLLPDGSGWKLEKTDILIDGKRMAAVRRLSDGEAGRVIDADGKLVMPGLINATTWRFSSGWTPCSGSRTT